MNRHLTLFVFIPVSKSSHMKLGWPSLFVRDQTLESSILAAAIPNGAHRRGSSDPLLPNALKKSETDILRWEMTLQESSSKN
jgi:hypothetical protein